MTRTGGSQRHRQLTSATTGYVDDGLRPATAYTYTVKAVDAAGNTLRRAPPPPRPPGHPADRPAPRSAATRARTPSTSC